MGTGMRSFAEIRIDDKWQKVEGVRFDDYDNSNAGPFEWRNYSVYGFLNNIRNYSCVPEMPWWDRGLPEDSEYLKRLNDPPFDKTIKDFILYINYSSSYIYLNELLDFDYSKIIEDRRCSRIEGNTTFVAFVAEPGEGKEQTYKEFLGAGFFRDLETLKTLGKPDEVRIIYYFC